MFTEALFTTAKTWKQPKCPLKKMETEDVVFPHTDAHTQTHMMVYYSATRKYEIMPFSAT